MKTIKKIFRVIVLALLILLALSGIGIVGAFFNKRERYLNKKVTIEMIDKKKKETSDVYRQ